MTSELLTAIAKHSYSSEELEKVEFHFAPWNLFHQSFDNTVFIFSHKVKAFVMNNSNELEAGGVNRILAAVRNNLFWLELTNWKSTKIPI